MGPVTSSPSITSVVSVKLPSGIPRCAADLFAHLLEVNKTELHLLVLLQMKPEQVSHIVVGGGGGGRQAGRQEEVC